MIETRNREIKEEKEHVVCDICGAAEPMDNSRWFTSSTPTSSGDMEYSHRVVIGWSFCLTANEQLINQAPNDSRKDICPACMAQIRKLTKETLYAQETGK